MLVSCSTTRSPLFLYPNNNNLNWKPRRCQFRIKSTDQDRDTTSSSSSVSTSSNSFLSLLCPLLKLFSEVNFRNVAANALIVKSFLTKGKHKLGGDPSQERNYVLEEATSSLSTFARLPWGSRSLPISTVDPPKTLQLFEFEACPFCRRVREAITELDLQVEIFPCPKGSKRHREMVRRLGGKEQFPYLVDPNTGASMYESGEIVKYLFQQYGKGRSPSFGLLESTPLTGWMPTILRAGRGMTLWDRASSEPPSKKLELFSYENNPYARIVREALCELELPYVHRTVGEGSKRIDTLLEASGSNEVPYIVDPNTGTKVGGYKKILSYLFQTYSMTVA